MSPEEFERYAKAELARETLDRKTAAARVASQAPERPLDWIAIGGASAVAVGALLGAGGLVAATPYANCARELDGAASLVTGASADDLRTQRDAAAATANGATIAG